MFRMIKMCGEIKRHKRTESTLFRQLFVSFLVIISLEFQINLQQLDCLYFYLKLMHPIYKTKLFFKKINKCWNTIRCNASNLKIEEESRRKFEGDAVQKSVPYKIDDDKKKVPLISTKNLGKCKQFSSAFFVAGHSNATRRVSWETQYQTTYDEEWFFVIRFDSIHYFVYICK